MRRSSLPRWVDAADACAVVCLVLATAATTFGGIRFSIGSIRVSGDRPMRLWIAAAFFLVLRHVLVRRHPLHRRVWDACVRAWRSPAFTAAWPVALGTRVPVLCVGLFAALTIGYPEPGPPFRVSANEFWNLPARWDAGWYLDIATHGYDVDATAKTQQNIAFFPAYPYLMHVGGALLGARLRTPVGNVLVLEHYRVRLLLAGVLISIAAFCWALVYLHRLAREEIGEDHASDVQVLLASYPFALFFSAAYTESLFLLCVVAAFFHFRHRDYFKAFAWGLVAGLTRPNGCLLSIPLAIVALEHTGAGPTWFIRLLRGEARPVHEFQPSDTGNRWRASVPALAAAAAPGVGMMIYSVFVYWLTGRPFAWAEAHGAWGRTYDSVGGSIAEHYQYYANSGLYAYVAAVPTDVLNGLAVVFALALVWPVTRRLGLAYGMFLVLNILPPLLTGGFVAMGRMTSVLFPLFFYLALAIPSSRRAIVVSAFGVLQGFAAVLFYTWRHLY